MAVKNVLKELVSADNKSRIQRNQFLEILKKHNLRHEDKGLLTVYRETLTAIYAILSLVSFFLFGHMGVYLIKDRD